MCEASLNGAGDDLELMLPGDDEQISLHGSQTSLWNDSELSGSQVDDDRVSQTNYEQDVVQLIDRLYRMSSALRSPARRHHINMASLRRPELVKRSDIELIATEFPFATTWLHERLASAISRRREYLRMGAEIELRKTNEDPAQHVEGAVTSEIPLLVDASSSSHVNRVIESPANDAYATQLATQDINDLKPPQLPDDRRNGEPFRCPLCFGMLAFESEHLWKEHIFDDLSPYTCLYEDCSDSNHCYSSRDHWKRHQLDLHYSYFTCPLCPGTEPFEKAVDLEDHLCEQHARIDDYVTLQSLIRSCSHTIEPPTDLHCPLCKRLCPTSDFWFRHTGNHLQQISLVSLPPHLTSETAANEMYGDKIGQSEELGRFDISFEAGNLHLSRPSATKGAAREPGLDKTIGLDEQRILVSTHHPEPSQSSNNLSANLNIPSLPQWKEVLSETKDLSLGQAIEMSSSQNQSQTATTPGKPDGLLQSFSALREDDAAPSSHIKLSRAGVTDEKGAAERPEGPGPEAKKSTPSPIAEKPNGSKRSARADKESLISQLKIALERLEAENDSTNENQDAFIQRQQEGHVTYVQLFNAKHVRLMLPSDDKTVQAKSNATTTRTDESWRKFLPPIIFRDASGNVFKFPFHEVRTWSNMKKLIERAYHSSGQITKWIQEERFWLYGIDHTIILPELWDYFVKPDMEVSLTLWQWSQPPPPPVPLYSGERASHNQFVSPGDYVQSNPKVDMNANKAWRATTADHGRDQWAHAKSNELSGSQENKGAFSPLARPTYEKVLEPKSPTPQMPWEAKGTMTAERSQSTASEIEQRRPPVVNPVRFNQKPMSTSTEGPDSGFYE